jgi:hypothetical protein
MDYSWRPISLISKYGQLFKMKFFKYVLISLMLAPLCFMLFSTHIASAYIAPPPGGGTTTTTTSPPTPCTNQPGTPNYSSTFLGLVPWYEYIPTTDFWVTKSENGDFCGFHVNFNSTTSSVKNETVTGVNQSSLDVIWLIGLAVFEDLLRVAGVAAVGFVIYGGIRYITSQGSPEQTGAALGTILHALIGLAIAIIAATSVAFIAKLFK